MSDLVHFLFHRPYFHLAIESRTTQSRWNCRTDKSSPAFSSSARPSDWLSIESSSDDPSGYPKASYSWDAAIGPTGADEEFFDDYATPSRCRRDLDRHRRRALSISRVVAFVRLVRRRHRLGRGVLTQRAMLPWRAASSCGSMPNDTLPWPPLTRSSSKPVRRRSCARLKRMNRTSPTWRRSFRRSCSNSSVCLTCPPPTLPLGWRFYLGPCRKPDTRPGPGCLRRVFGAALLQPDHPPRQPDPGGGVHRSASGRPVAATPPLEAGETHSSVPYTSVVEEALQQYCSTLWKFGNETRGLCEIWFNST